MHKNNRKTNDQKLSLNVSCYVSCYTLCNESKNEQISSGYILVCNRLTPHPRHVLGIQPCTHCMDFSSNTQNIKRKINESILLNSVKNKNQNLKESQASASVSPVPRPTIQSARRCLHHPNIYRYSETPSSPPPTPLCNRSPSFHQTKPQSRHGEQPRSSA